MFCGSELSYSLRKEGAILGKKLFFMPRNIRFSPKVALDLERSIWPKMLYPEKGTSAGVSIGPENRVLIWLG